MQFEALTYKIIGCAMNVLSMLGCGFQEVIYQRALAIEFRMQELPYSREMEMPVFYKGIEIGTRRVDFFVAEFIMVELKAISMLQENQLAQAMNYCEAFNLPIGLLLNFGSKSLEYKRIYNLNHPENKKKRDKF